MKDQSTEPSITATEEGYRVNLPCRGDARVLIDFTELESDGGSLQAKAATWLLGPDGTEGPYTARVDLHSMNEESFYRRQVVEGLFGRLDRDVDTKDWILPFNHACRMVIEAVGKEDLSVDLSQVRADTEVPYLVPPLVLANGASVLFGQGGSAKTYLALAMAMSMVKGWDFLGQHCRQGKVLFVDYEATEEAIKGRLRRLAAGRGAEWDDDAALVYWRTRGRPLAEMLPGLDRKIKDEDVQCIIVDSAGMACGGDPKEESAALGYSNTLARLGIPSLTLCHASKNDSQRFPYGSIFWSNSPRLTWNVQVRSEQDGLLVLDLFNRKSNEERLVDPIQVRVDFSGNGRVRIVGGAAKCGGRQASLTERLRSALQSGVKKSVQELADELGVKENAVRARLTDRRNAGKFAKQGKLWGLA